MTARLDITGAAYVLARQEGGAWRDLARLDGGASALLPAPGRPAASDADIEAAIERAEEWLMPHARALTGDVLEVRDATGLLARALRRDGVFSLEQLEAEFNRVVASRSAQDRDPAAVAHLVLVRELSPHGRVAGVSLGTAGGRPQGPEAARGPLSARAPVPSPSPSHRPSRRET